MTFFRRVPSPLKSFFSLTVNFIPQTVIAKYNGFGIHTGFEWFLYRESQHTLNRPAGLAHNVMYHRDPNDIHHVFRLPLLFHILHGNPLYRKVLSSDFSYTELKMSRHNRQDSSLPHLVHSIRYRTEKDSPRAHSRYRRPYIEFPLPTLLKND